MSGLRAVVYVDVADDGRHLRWCMDHLSQRGYVLVGLARGSDEDMAPWLGALAMVKAGEADVVVVAVFPLHAQVELAGAGWDEAHGLRPRLTDRGRSMAHPVAADHPWRHDWPRQPEDDRRPVRLR